MANFFHGTSLAKATSILQCGFDRGCFASDLMAALDWSDDPKEPVILNIECSQEELGAWFDSSKKATKFGGCVQFRLKEGLAIPAVRIRRMSPAEIISHSDFAIGG